MSVKLNTFYRGPAGSAMKFDEIGDFLDGVVLDAAMIPDEHNAGLELLLIKMIVRSAKIGGEPVLIPDDADLVKDLYVRAAGMKDALGEAVGKAGCESIDAGARLRLEYTGDKALKNGRAMKLYGATYEPPQPIGVAAFGDEQPEGF